MSLLALRLGTVDLVRGQLRGSDGRTVELTTREVALLDFLARRPGEEVSRDTLLVEVWGHRPDSLSRAVDHTMRRLRGKVEADPAHPQHLLTVHGTGYRFAPLAAAPPAAAGPGKRFIGRHAELKQLEAATSTHALVEVLGPGGMGKTRLVRQWLPPEGRFVDLAPVRGPGRAGIEAAVARALGVGRRAVAAVLADTAPLLVLDNCEQVAAPLCDWLAGLEPGPRMVLTSRIALPLPPDLPLPLGSRTALHLGGLPTGAAVELYCQRATEAGQPAGADPAVEQLVTMLDRLPLAIELAAARAPVLGAQDLLERLAHQRFAALGSRSSGPARHQALDRAIAWSWALLDPAERAAMGRLTAFSGGFSAEAAEAVLGEGALATLEGLARASLLAGEPGAQRRSRLLESIHAYALQHAPPESIRAGRDAHLAWFSQAAARWREAAGRDAEARGALAREQENLLAASQHAESLGRASVELVAAVAPRLEAEGPPELWARLVAAVQELGPAGARLEARRLLALGDAAGAARVLEGTPETTAPHALLQARVQRACRDHAAAAAAIARGLDAAPEGAERVRLIHQDALLAIDEGDFPRARRRGREALAAWRALGHDQDGARASCHLGHVALETGEVDEAVVRYAHAEDILASTGDRRGAAVAGAHRALAAIETGDHAEAAAALDRAAAHARAVGDRRFAAFVGLVRADLALEQGALREARRRASAARLALEDLGDHTFAAAAAVRLAVACARQGDAAGTERAVATARQGLGTAGGPEVDGLLDGVLARSRGQLAAVQEQLSAARPTRHLPRRLCAWLAAG